MVTSNYRSCNKNAIKEVDNVLNYLSTIRGKGVLTGQHTLTMQQEELWKIQEITGKLPAICGFELLSYSPNINYGDASKECLIEVEANKGTLEKVWEWVNDYHGLVTMTWHWFSPIGGRDKAFYSQHTDFDPEQALIEGTKENRALIADMDHMASLLKAFCDKKVPILWRPFHESEGTWFWWGSKGPGVAKKLFQLMYERYTEVHELNNLIWVWNSPTHEGYVGDGYNDILSLDLYPEKHTVQRLEKAYQGLKDMTKTDKIIALAEVGTIPDIIGLEDGQVPWAWFMMWSYPFIGSEEYNYEKDIALQYKSTYAITLDQLARLY